MKPFWKRAAISLLIGVALTFVLGGLEYVALGKPGFARTASCGANPLCNLSSNMPIGFPWAFGKYDDSSDRTIVLSFTNAPSVEDGELAQRYYMGFVADVVLYGLLSFAVLSLWPRFRRKD